MKHHQRSLRGQAVVLIAFALVPILGLAGLAVDVGGLYAERRLAQATADLATSAGAQEASRAGTHARFEDVVLAYAHKNGFGPEYGDTVVTNHPPLGGPYKGNSEAYEVILRRSVPMTLMRALGSNSSVVVGRSVALVTKGGIGILVLDPTKADAFKLEGKAQLNLTSGTVHVNSVASNALHVKDQSQLRTNGPAVVVGNYKRDGTNSVLTPTPSVSAAPMADPLAGLSDPPCDLTVQGPGTVDKPVTLNPKDGDVLCPGIYYGGIKIDHNISVTFSTCGEPPERAIFAVTNAGLHVHSSDLSAEGVIIYNTTNKWCTPKDDNHCGQIHFDNKATVTLTPPTAGTYEGIAIFQDRDCNKQFNLSGNALAGIVGDIYMPTATVSVKGKKGKKNKANPTNVVKAGFIVKTMKWAEVVSTDDPTELDGEPTDPNDGDPAFALSSAVGGSVRRAILAE